MKVLSNVAEIFGKQLQKYRQEVGLTQEEYGKIHGVGQRYIASMELGKRDFQLNTMQKHASTFGVNYFQLGDPDFPIPRLDQMPTAIRRAAEKAAKKREKALVEKEAKRESGGKIYKVGTAAELHKLIAEGFFDVPRTSREAYLKLNPKIDEKELTEYDRIEIGKITGTLSKGKFTKLLDKLVPTDGNKAVKFKIK